ncbi:MAG TPA: hypothetical protein VFJ61_06305 [Solirubrobacterales bacterium]|nr:hypothetical protein [Solirubrobacterales bacterium]
MADGVNATENAMQPSGGHRVIDHSASHAEISHLLARDNAMLPGRKLGQAVAHSCGAPFPRHRGIRRTAPDLAPFL